jgi:Flp pilus assembly protein TadD
MRTGSIVVRLGVLVALISVGAASPSAQAGRGAAADTLVRQMRTAIGHGAVAEAQRLVDAAPASASKSLATAVLDVFLGKDDQARELLKPLADADPLGEAALEFGLLEQRHGRRDESRAIVNRIASVRNFPNPTEDYYRLARAARANREYLLANDAYQRIATVARADIQTEWADMLFERHKPDLSLQSYGDALKADPAWIPAHLGIARVLADENPERAAAALEAARKLGPDDRRVLILTAERQLASEDPAGAAQTLDRLGTPGIIAEAALRAAVSYALKHPAEVDTALARVRDIDPRSALGLRKVAEQVADAYRFDDAADMARKAVALDGDDQHAHFLVGLYLLRTGDEKGARTALARSWELDPSNPVTKNLLDMLDNLDAFEVVPDGDMIFKLPRDQAAVLKVYALPLADQAYQTYVERYGFKPKGPILIEMFSKHDDFAVRTIGIPGITGALGACFGRVVSMDTPTAHPKIDFSWQATLWHELAHVFTLQLSDYHVPRWLTEGISVFEEHRKTPAWGRELNLEYARLLGQGKTFGVKKLPEAFKHPETLSIAYFEASLVVEHLVAQNGDAGVRTLLIAYASGATDTEAFAKAFGKSIDDVEKSFGGFVEQNFGALRDALKDPPSQVDSTDLPALRARAAMALGNFASQLTFGRELLKSGDVAGAKPVLERAARLAPQATGDGSPHALLAQLAMQQGDQAGARAHLRALLAYDHTNIDAARKLAQLGAEAKALDDENVGLRLVADLNPFDPDVHGTLGARELAKGALQSALLEFRAALALGPVNLAVAHTDVADVLLRMNRKDEAKREALLALQEAPTYARAQDILLAAIGKERQ